MLYVGISRRNYSKGRECKTKKNRIFLKNGKTVNYNNSTGRKLGNETHSWIRHTKSSQQDEFRRILRKLNSHIFRGNVCRVTPNDKIVYGNLKNWEINWVKFLGYNLNLN